MKKRVLSLFMALALCLTMLPTAALAETVNNTVRNGQDSTNVNNSYVLDNDTTVPDVEEIDEAVRAAQALIDALPDEVTADNAETLQEQLLALDEALDALTDEQLAALDMTRYKALCEAMTTLTAEQATHTDHALCTHGDNCTICPKNAKAKDAFADAQKLTVVSNVLYIGGVKASPDSDAVNASYRLPAGSYYLDEDIVSDRTIRVEGEVNLCLNGHSIEPTRYGKSTWIFVIKDGATLNLCDCSADQSGKILRTMRNDACVGIGSTGGNFVLYSGTLTALGTEESVKGSQRGVYMANGSFTMYGGQITGNTADTDGYGGGVYMAGGSFTMCDGTITGNTAAGSNCSGGVYMGSNASLTVSGNVNISGNTGGNVYLSSGKSITIGKSLTDSANIGVTVDGDKLPTGAGEYATIAKAADGYTITTDDAKRVSADAGTDYTVQKKDNALVLVKGELPHQHPICGATHTGIGDHTGACADVTWTELTVKNDKLYIGNDMATPSDYSSDSQYSNYYTLSKGNYYLGEDIQIGELLQIEGEVNLCLNGHSITKTTDDKQGDDGVIRIAKDGSFSLCDCKESVTNNGKITHASDKIGRGVWGGSKATFNMYGGEISGNYAGGTKQGQNGAGVGMTSGKFTMYGGKITNNQIKREENSFGGGGVYVSGGSFTMHGGEISHNTSIKNGGGVSTVFNGSIKICGGTISDNEAAMNGGGVYATGNVAISGGEISANTATENGGGVYYSGTSSDDKLTVSDTAKIEGNNATQNGGGVYFNGSGKFNVSGSVSITGNKGDCKVDDTNGTLTDGTDNNVYLPSGKTITIAGELKNSTPIGVTTEATPSSSDYVKIATGSAANANLNKFTYEKKSADGKDIPLITIPNANGGVDIVACVHSWKTEWNKNDSYHWHVCSLCGGGKGSLAAHEWGVRVSSSAANVLEEYCTTEGCGGTGGTLTLTADDAPFDGEAYDGAEWSTQGWKGQTVSIDMINYAEKTGENTFASITGAPTKAGDYCASITVGGVTATKEFKISRATLSPTLIGSDFNVVVPNNPTYDGQPKTVTKAEFRSDSKKQWFGEITVKYYDEEDGTQVDEPTNAGTYRVKLDVAAGDGYEAVNNIDGGWTFTIQQADPNLSFARNEVTITWGDTFENTLTNDGDGEVTYGSTNTAVASFDTNGDLLIHGAGTTTITADSAETGNYNAGHASYTLTVEKVVIHIESVTVSDKFYDGTNTATVTEITFANENGVSVPNVTYNVTEAAFSDANASETAIEVTGKITLTGSFAQNYELRNGDNTWSTTAKINKMPLTINTVMTENRDYVQGNTGVAIKSIGFTDKDDRVVDLVKETDYTVTGEMTDDNAGKDKTVTITVNLSEAIARNYDLQPIGFTVKVTINMVDPARPADLTGWQGNALSTVTLPSGWTWKDGTAVMNETGSKAFSAHYGGDTNHKAGDYTVTITVSEKNSASLGNFAQPACTYGDTLPDATYDTVDGVTTTTIQYTGTANDGTAYGPSSAKPTQAGDYTVTVTCETLDTIYSGTAGFTIAKKSIELDVTLDCGEGFVYDGTAKTPSVTVNFKGTTTALPTGEYTVSYSNNINASNNQIDGVVTIASTGTGNYTFGAGYYHFNIAQKELTMSASVTEKKYDGSTSATVTPGALSGVVDGDGGDVSVAEASVSGIFNDQYVGTGKNVTLSQNFTLTGSKAGNYTLAQPTVTGSIIAADQTPTIIPAASVPRGGKTVDLSGLVTGAQGTVSFAISEGGAYAELNGSTLETKSDVGTVKITVTIDEADLNNDDTPEYNAYTGADAITVSVTLKAAPTVTAPAAAANLVYNGTAQTLISAGSAQGGELQYRLNGSAYSTELPTATDAGDYTVYYKAFGDNDHEDSVEQSFTVTLQKATVTITAKNRSAYVGDTAPDLNTPAANKDYTVEGLFDGDTLGGTLALTYDPAPDMTKVGETVIKASGADAGANYTIAYVDGKLTISNRPSSTPSAPTITVPVTGSRDTVQISASVSDGTAEVAEIEKSELEKVGTDSDVTIDLSGLDKDVTGVTLPRDTIRSISESEADGVTIKLPNAELRVDQKTLASAAEQAKGDKVQLVVETDSKAKDTMTAAQKQALDGMKNAAALEAYFVSNGQRIRDFNGGEVELSIPYQASGAIRAWYLKEDGTREPVSARYDRENARLILRHFSHYVIEEVESGMGYAACAKDDTCPLAAFADLVPTAWYHDGVHYCIENGLMQGVSATSFLPNGSTTRAQLVTILWRLEGSPAVSGAESFTDVKDGAWYAQAVRWAADSGVVKGYDDGRFGPDDAVTREQMVTILYRYAQYKGYDVSVGEDTNILSFNDALTVSGYAVPAMQWACGSGLMTGIAQDGGMLLAPKDTTTRVQTATLMMRF